MALLGFPLHLHKCCSGFCFAFSIKNRPEALKYRGYHCLYFYCLVFASVCIAAAGYIINDYFDVNIDLINKPAKLIVDRYIKRRWTIVWHIVLSFIGLIISCYVGYKLRNFLYHYLIFAAIIALWFLLNHFQKKTSNRKYNSIITYGMGYSCLCFFRI